MSNTKNFKWRSMKFVPEMVAEIYIIEIHKNKIYILVFLLFWCVRYLKAAPNKTLSNI